jgi:FemAB-related protein (PEP-CTERM system-associated)
MSIKFDRASKEEKYQWDSFVKTHPKGTPYHLWEYGEAFSETYGYKRYYLVSRIKGNIVGIFPLILIRSRLFRDKLISLPFCEHGGPLINSDLKNTAVEFIAKTFLDDALSLGTNLGVDYLELRNPSLTNDYLCRDFSKQVSRYVTFKLNLLSGENQLWRFLDKKTRNSIRKSEKSNITISEILDEAMLKKYFSLYLKIEKKYGSPPHSFSVFKSLARFETNVKYLLALHNSTPVAGVIIFYSNDEIYWWNGVSDPRLRNINATSLLLWEVIKWGCKEGYSYMSFGRTRKDTGVYHFKEAWGGKETCYIDYIYPLKDGQFSTPDPSEGKYQLLTKLWAYLPIIVSSSLGPLIIKQIGL